MLYVFTANRTKRSLAEKAQNLDFSVLFRQTRRVRRCCMYLPQAVQNKVLRKKAQNLDFVKFFSLDKACAAMLYVYTASCTERSITEKRHEITRETLCRSPHP